MQNLTTVSPAELRASGWTVEEYEANMLPNLWEAHRKEADGTVSVLCTSVDDVYHAELATYPLSVLTDGDQVDWNVFHSDAQLSYTYALLNGATLGLLPSRA